VTKFSKNLNENWPDCLLLIPNKSGPWMLGQNDQKLAIVRIVLAWTARVVCYDSLVLLHHARSGRQRQSNSTRVWWG
jgi:hypothetical protein